jgi:hypothetical protein
MLVDSFIRKYYRYSDVLLAGNHSYVTYRYADAQRVCDHQAELWSRICAAEVVSHPGAKLGANGIR